MRLDPAAATAGVRLAAYDEIGSTNAEALRCAREGDRGPLWIVAKRQKAGRGRHGRSWVSAPGNLYATLLLNDPGPPSRAPELAFVAAIATYDAVAELAPAVHPQLKLKWPNDLLCDGAKLGGILIEGEGTAVAIGIGVNCRHHPADTMYPATDLAACGATVPPADLMAALSKAMMQRLEQWQGGSGFTAIRQAWLARAQEPGSAIRVRIGERELSGGYEGIDESGRLLLRSAAGALETISAGDVLTPSPQTAAAVT
jgi:BirA family biotin operon repressor/biotin-[acetyl-CoA-carboxylase] ligase